MAKQQAAVREIWMVSREYGTLAGAGGVKDVVSQLAVTLARWSGRSVHVVLPCYGFMNPEELGFSLLSDPLQPENNLTFEVDLNYPEAERRERIRVWTARQERVNIYLLDAERFREKQDVYTYTAAEEASQPWQIKGEGHFDYFAMNILLQKGSLALMMLLGAHPDIIHCHDGHTAILPAMISERPGLRHYFRSSSSVVTVHNAGRGYHQEMADLDFAHAITGLPMSFILHARLEGQFDPFLAGASSAVMNTVSGNYAKELRESSDDRLTGWLGHVLQEGGVVLEGVTNGIDPDVITAKDHLRSGIAAPFDILGDAPLTGKAQCKKVLIRLLAERNEVAGIRQSGFLNADPGIPLVTFIGRLSEQKGVDVLTGALARLLEERRDFSFLLLGTGNRQDEKGLVQLAEKSENLGRICILRGYDTKLANKIYAAGDFFLVPSRYEPCGLTDFMAQLFGNLPIVHHVGGLVKVIEGETGFAYQKQSVTDLVQAIQRALQLYASDPSAIRRMQRQAVELIHKQYTWSAVARHYLDLYRKAVQERMERQM